MAEARAKARGLTSIRFITGDLLAAPEHGPFDYIDCCGVLHHLPEPDAGFRALAAALAPGGDMGLIIYLPYAHFILSHTAAFIPINKGHCRFMCWRLLHTTANHCIVFGRCKGCF